MISNKTKHQFLYNSMRATRLAYLDLARNMLCKKWAELRGNTQIHWTLFLFYPKVCQLFLTVEMKSLRICQ
jgi:hypothetical protein